MLHNAQVIQADLSKYAEIGVLDLLALRRRLATLRLLWQKHGLNVGQDAALGNGDAGHQLV